MEKNNKTHATFRKSRTRTLIQLGGLFEKSGLMESFDLQVGGDLQKDIHKKDQVFALLGGLSELKEMMQQSEFPIDLLAQKGTELFNIEIIFINKKGFEMDVLTNNLLIFSLGFVGGFLAFRAANQKTPNYFFGLGLFVAGLFMVYVFAKNCDIYPIKNDVIETLQEELSIEK